MNALDMTQVEAVLQQAREQAALAAQETYSRIGERDACGFAWVRVYDVRINSKLGKALVSAGFRKAWDKGLELWNPSQHGTQSISVKEAGAYAYAEVLRNAGIEKAYAGSRMD